MLLLFQDVLHGLLSMAVYVVVPRCATCTTINGSLFFTGIRNFYLQQNEEDTKLQEMYL